jgi:hypothetical protein
MTSGPVAYLLKIAINNFHGSLDEPMAQMGMALADAGLKSVGRLVDLTQPREVLEPGGINILLGHVAFARNRILDALAGAPFILWQLDPLSRHTGPLHSNPEYLELIERATRVWDYNANNAAILAAWGRPDARVLPFGHQPALATIPTEVAKDIDVCFFGWGSERRVDLARRLKSAGLRVHFNQKCYGAERDAIIARSHIALNVHAYDRLPLLEEARISFLLSNRRFVISELADHDPYDGGVIYAPFNNLVDICRYWLTQPEAARMAVAERGHAAVQRRPFTAALTAAVADAVPAVMAAWDRHRSSAMSAPGRPDLAQAL